MHVSATQPQAPIQSHLSLSRPLPSHPFHCPNLVSQPTGPSDTTSMSHPPSEPTPVSPSRPPGYKTLSPRGCAALAPLPKYLNLSFAARSDRFDTRSNPGGFIDCSVAENRLSLPLVSKALRRATAAEPVPDNELVYGSMNGRPRLKKALANLFSRHLLKVPVREEEIAVSAGAGSVIDLLATVLCDAGDGVMVTAPGYSGFKNDISSRAGCRLVVAPMAREGGFKVDVETLERCWVKAGGAQSGIKMVVLSSPNNPTGEVLSGETVQEIVDWAAGKDGIHLVMDEIYGLSLFDEEGDGFVSVAAVMDGRLGDRVHVVWSFSKDFCLSGERMGVLYSQNTALHGCFEGLTYFSSPAATAQWELALMLEDNTFLETYLVENRLLLGRGYLSSKRTLDELGIPFLPSRAGFFIMLDLRRWLVGDDLPKAEEVLYDAICEAKVLFSPAGQMFSQEYGWFRCCFSAVEPAALEVAWQRLGKTLRRIKPL